MPVPSELLEELLAKPVGPALTGREAQERDYTRKIEVNGSTASIEVAIPIENVEDDTALSFLAAEGLDPTDWEVTGFRRSEWESGDELKTSVRFTYKRSEKPLRAPLPLDEIFDGLADYTPIYDRPTGSYGFLVLVGDMQFGKIDGDGVEGTLHRTVECLNLAADWLDRYREIFDIGHVHIAWLGDHVEGFVSQGGANTWRTQLTLNEQIRLTRRVMLHSLKTFAPMAEKVSLAAVPGNHGEAVRFGGTGLTRYDDSHDTEALIAVADAAAMLPEAFGHVDFFVPDTDELIVMTEVAGTKVAHHHGHKWRPGKHFDWWSGQAFNRDSAMHVADLLVSGHLHHRHIEQDGSRLFIGTPAMESDSTWFRHNTGTGGAPGLIVAITKDGHTPIEHMIAAEGVGN